MGAPGLRRAAAALGLLALAATGARAQAPAGAPGRAQVEDRVFALVQAGKCGQAKTAAERGDAPDLAEQISEMCGVSPTAAAPARQGGGGGRGGGGQGAPGSAGAGSRRGGP